MWRMHNHHYAKHREFKERTPGKEKAVYEDFSVHRFFALSVAFTFIGRSSTLPTILKHCKGKHFSDINQIKKQ